jgi:hypothetical protein
MQMPVREPIVLMTMPVNAQGAHEGRDADSDQGQAHDTLDPWREMMGEPPPGEHERTTNRQDHQGMSDAPSRSDRERPAPVRSSAHENPNGGEVIGRE